MADLETLELRIKDSSSEATTPLKGLADALKDIKSASSGSTTGLTKTAAGIDAVAISANKIGSNTGARITSLVNGLTRLQTIGNLKISSTIPNNLTKIVASISGIKSDAGAKITQLVNGLKPLNELGRANLTSYITQIGKLPDVIDKLDNTDVDKFTRQMKELATAIAPLASEMNKIAAGFSAFPSKIQKTIASIDKYDTKVKTATTSTGMFGNSFTGLATRTGIVVYGLQRVFDVIGGFIDQSNAYQENLNLFTASMGEFTEEAMNYAEQVSDVMGIDVSAWIRNQGIFMTLATGFGVVNEQAALMSKNLTQLGYDISSFYNISVEDSMQKLQSALSGRICLFVGKLANVICLIRGNSHRFLTSLKANVMIRLWGWIEPETIPT